MNIWHDIDPKRITPEDFVAVIEIPKGSKKKYELDKETGLIMLDLNRYDERSQADAYGFVSDELLSWLDVVFEKIGGGQNAVVCAHYPIQPVLTETVTDGEKLFALLERQNVRLYLCGHRHLHETYLGGSIRRA